MVESSTHVNIPRLQKGISLKLRLLFVLIAILIGGTLLVSAQSTPLPTATPPLSVVIVPDIYVRGGPSQSYVPVGQLLGGELVIPVSRNEAADWVLIRYNTGYGWIRRDLAYWVENIDELPIIDPSNLTPSPEPGKETATPFFPTETPTGNYINVGPQGAFVRAGPGRSYLRLGTLYSGESIRLPVGRNRDTTWIMFRYGEGFGWIATNSVKWTTDIDRLPVLLEGNLTPSATYTASATRTPSLTPTLTATPTASFTATQRPTSTNTVTATVTFTSTPSATSTATTTATFTNSPVPTATATFTPSPTSTLTHTATYTPLPTDTSTATPMPEQSSAPTKTVVTQTSSDTPTVTYTPSPDMTLVSILAATLNAPTQTDVPTATTTATPRPTNTTQPSSTPTATETHTPTPTATLTNTPTDVSTETPAPSTTHTLTFTPTATTTQTQTHTPAPTDTATIVVTQTSTATSAVVVQNVDSTAAPPTPTLQETPPDGVGSIQPEAVIGGIILFSVLGYIAFYLRGVTAAERYATGFVVEHCPACHQGNLVIETRQERFLGIPRPRRTVRCTNCRSLLREVSSRRWRYAVDPLQNTALYERYNGREIDEETLKSLATVGQIPAVPRPPVTPPSFVDDEE